jgi:diacylglycerol kinase (ATP)
VIACGGDGTIMFVIEEIMHFGGIDFNKICLGVLPLGTGNDFSRALGWGGAFDEDLMEKDGA